MDQRCRPSLRATNDSYRVDETYIKIKKHWYYLYRVVDSMGAMLDFMLSASRDAGAAEQFFRKGLDAGHTTLPRVISVDKHAAYPDDSAQAASQRTPPPQLSATGAVR